MWVPWREIQSLQAVPRLSQDARAEEPEVRRLLTKGPDISFSAFRMKMDEDHPTSMGFQVPHGFSRAG